MSPHCVCFMFLNAIALANSCKVNKFNPFRTKQHIAALILARGGSKGIQLKNLATVNGRSLLAISLEAISEVPQIDSVWVSTDHVKIHEEAVRTNKNVNIHWRSAESATDEATSIFAVRDFLTWRPEIDVVLLVQCTSPFIRREYLTKARDLIMENDVECVFSVTKSFKLRWLRKANGEVVPINFDPLSRPRRQDWGGEFVENGMFYVARRRLLERGVFQSRNCQLIEIPERDSLEIDTKHHLRLARHLHLHVEY